MALFHFPGYYVDHQKLTALQTLGTPYKSEELFSQGVPRSSDLERKEIIALIAYLQRLGTDIKRKEL